MPAPPTAFSASPNGVAGQRTANPAPSSPSPLPWQEKREPVGPTNIKVSQLSTLSSRLFLSHLSSIPTSKTLILDPALAGPLGLVVDTNSLTSVGVDRMFWMEERDATILRGKNVSAPTKAVVYVCRPDEKWMKVIRSHINFDVANSNDSSLAHSYHALLTPHRTELSLLSLSPVLPHLNLYDFGVEFVPLEPDLLSLEEPGASWKDLYLAGDQTVLHRSAMALMTCQMLWGCFPKITGKGDLSRRLADLLIRQRREHLAGDPINPSLSTLSSVIDGLVIVERGTDMVTPMCSQLTYAGLLDEIFGIKSAHVEVDQSILDASSKPPADPWTPSGSSTPLVKPSFSRPFKKHRLDPTTDVLYSYIRDLNFSVVGSVLHSFARRLSSSYQDRHSANTVSKMRAWVGKLGGLQSEHTALRLHTVLTEELMSKTNSEVFNRCLEIQQNIVAGLDLNSQLAAIEELINVEISLHMVLRLLCLFSTVAGGIKPKNLEHIKREICQTYGYEQVTTLLNLERAGLIVKTRAAAGGVATALAGAAGSGAITAVSIDSVSASGNAALHCFDRVRQPLRLINDDVSESDPTDVAFVYSGYAPLSVRLIQTVGQKEALVGGAAADIGPASTATLKSTNPTKKLRAHPLVGWRGFEEVMEAVPGETFDLAQPVSPTDSMSGQGWIQSDITQPSSATTLQAGVARSKGQATSSHPTSASNAPWSSDPDRKRTTVVFFLGGVTQAEVAAVRFMGSQSRNRRWLVATTGLITGSAIIDMAGANAGSASEKLSKRQQKLVGGRRNMAV